MAARIYLPEFELEAFFSGWEFKARCLLCAPDAESPSLRQLPDRIRIGVRHADIEEGLGVLRSHLLRRRG